MVLNIEFNLKLHLPCIAVSHFEVLSQGFIQPIEYP